MASATPERVSKWHKDHPDEVRAIKRRYYERNKAVVIARSKAQREADPEKSRAYMRVYHANNPRDLTEYRREYRQKNRQKLLDDTQRRRAKIRNAPTVERIDREAVYIRDGGICHICGGKVPHRGFNLDHLVPLSRGGAHVATNVRVAHGSCNFRRGPGRLPAQLILV